MATLSDASLQTKQILKYIIIFFLSIVLIFFIIRIGLIIKDRFFPAPPPKPTNAFGLLPRQIFPPSVTGSKLSYSLNTVTGNYPTFPQQIYVYKIQPTIPDLLAANKMDQKAQTIGFSQGYTAVTDKIYQWTNTRNHIEINKTLSANVFTGDFNISSGYLTDPDVLASRNLRKESDAISSAINMLASMGLPTADLDMANAKTNLYSIVNGSIVSGSSLSQAQIIEVYFNQKDIDKTKIVYDNPNSSNISIYFGGGSRMQVVAAKYIHHLVAPDKAVYILKPANQAFDELKKGNGYIATYTGTSNSVSVNDISLAYYMSSQPQDFLMPVYVFTGSDNFVAYVPAIIDESISK